MLRKIKTLFALFFLTVMMFATPSESTSSNPKMLSPPPCNKVICNSAKSTTILPNDENFYCKDYAFSQKVLQMEGDSPESVYPVGHLSGPESPGGTEKVGETAKYVYNPETGKLNIRSSVPMNFVILENQNHANVYYYPSGSAVTEDTGLYLYDARAERATVLPIQKLHVCYNLTAGVGEPKGLPEACRDDCELPGFEEELEITCKPGSEGTVVMAYQSASNRTSTEVEGPAAKYGRVVCDPEGKGTIALCDFAGTDPNVPDCFAKGDFQLDRVQTIQIYDDGVVLCEWPEIAINIGGTQACFKLF